MKENNYLSIDETAEKLDISRNTLYDWIKDGKAPKHERIMGRYAFYLDSVLRMKDKREKEINQ